MVEYTIIPESYRDTKGRLDINNIREKYDGTNNPSFIYDACVDDPVIFAWYMLGIKLRDYQIYMMDSMVKNRFVQGCWSRRMGKSTLFKIFSMWALRFNKYPQGIDGATKIIVLAHTQDQADSYISETKQFIDMGDERVALVFGGQLGKKFFSSVLPKKTDRAKLNTSELSFYNGGWNTMKTFPPTSRARGNPASIIIMDELAFWQDYTPDEDAIYNEVVIPIITDSDLSKAFIASTPNGVTGKFYELMDIDNHKTQYKLFWYPYYYNRDSRYLASMKEFEEQYTSQGEYDAFRQEFLAELITRNSSYFDKEDEVDRVFDSDHLPVTSFTGRCHGALDFGGSMKSRTVFTASYLDKDGKIRRIYHHRYPVAKDSTLREDILMWSKRFNIVKWHIDSQGGGSSFYDWFKNNFGRDKIEEVSFRGEKADMYRLFKIACYQDRIKSYRDDELYNEFINFTNDLKPTKTSTDDMLDSFVMSCKEWLVTKTKTKARVIRI